VTDLELQQKWQDYLRRYKEWKKDLEAFRSLDKLLQVKGFLTIEESKDILARAKGLRDVGDALRKEVAFLRLSSKNNLSDLPN